MAWQYQGLNSDVSSTESPKVAFTVGLTNSGDTVAGETAMNLIYAKIFTNVGKAYNPATGL